MVTKYKSEMYKGEKIVFVKANSSKFGIHAKAVNRPMILGMGSTKAKAFDDLKNSVDRIDRAGNWYKKKR